MKSLLFSLILVISLGVPAFAQAAEESDANTEKLNAAITLFQSKELSKAEDAFRALRAENLQTSTWGMVSNNLGITLKAQKKYSEAIKVFKSVLESDVNDRDPGGHLMESFRNYKNKAAIQIALCYEAQGEIEKSLEYIELATSQYAFQADCGNCASDAEAALGRHKARLEEKKK
jgi:tetratricopeptide (TPR) repeat protein